MPIGAAPLPVCEKARKRESQEQEHFPDLSMTRAWSILPWQTTCMMGNSHLHHRPCWPACPSQLWGSGWAAKGTFSPAGQEQLIVFKNPICSLPEVGGFGGGGEGSVRTVTWHWKERPEVSAWLLTRHCSQARHTEASPSSER